METLDHHSRLARALRGEAVDRPPVWFMRQAGRYLPEYREVRAKVSFEQLCADPDLACEVTLQPLRRFKLDAAIVFSDILPVVEAVGRPVRFDKGAGPRVLNPLRDASEVRELVHPDVAKVLSVVPRTLKLFREARPDVPILGFAGAPWTLMCYLVEGSGSKDWLHPKQFLWQHPKEAAELLNLLADVVGEYLQSQVEAGAAGVQLFDTWAGVLSGEDYRRWALPAARRALAHVKGAPRIYYTKDTASFLPWIQEIGADVIGLDWRMDIGVARQALGVTPIQGNLDPTLLFAPPDEVKRRVKSICAEAGPLGHVFNLGHGVLPGTPIEGVQAMVDAVHELGPSI